MSDSKSPEPQGLKIDRSFVKIELGELVCHRKSTYRITQVLDFNSVLGLDIEMGRPKVLRIQELKPFIGSKIVGPYADYDLEDIGTEEWAIAQKRYTVIQPLLRYEGQPKKIVEERAKESGVDPVTIYRWLRRYKERGELTGLIPSKRGWSPGRSRISPEVEEVIKTVLDEYYLTPQRPDVASTVYQARKACRALKLPQPAVRTVQARINNIPERVRLLRRGDIELANNKHAARVGSLETEYPLQIVQIDHSPIDLIIVDDVHRKPIGRPWLTIAICVHTRMVTGYYLSMQAPSALSVAMCVVHSILPKEQWLAQHGISGEWPVWGKMTTLHSDNGRDFKTENLIRSLNNHAIHKEFRPKGEKHWGGHIERYINSNSRHSKRDKGATFSNPLERREYDSDGEAIYTFAEFEARLIRNILKYHEQFHNGLGMAPIRKWNLAFFGDKEHTPISPLPPRVADPWSFQLDFLPSAERVIHPYGVEMDAMYFAEALRPWVGATDPATGKQRKFLFRRDPRDINRIWFKDPALNEYFEVPILRARYQGGTVAEYVNAKKKSRAAGLGAVNEELVDRFSDENKRQEIEAAEKTKQARKSAQSRANNMKQSTPARPSPIPEPTVELPASSEMLSIDEVDTFGDVW
ncbi:helix-turn-helix domain-containing protein [Pseudomonas japonica]|uniref:Putative transposase n=1 Tax=Pseudomonas japonica TaxID=256466 RepID=A0A239C654_9PSED|nr:helix-turn-helix domain-containing protein [Pseudomonas japonica]SNS15590.1 putative transposase [Pseudomonas japonica]